MVRGETWKIEEAAALRVMQDALEIGVLARRVAGFALIACYVSAMSVPGTA
jgi:hypothetical protein